jgi:hypothetical protein
MKRSTVRRALPAVILGSAVTAVALAPSTQPAESTPTDSRPADTRRDEQRLSFQTHKAWAAREQINADVAMCYGIDKTLPERMQSWRDHGYITELMTGVAWGEYQDYLYGRWDGINHEDEAQVESNGKKVGHGGDVYYMSPGPDYGNYLASGVLKALDAGAQAVYLEEPEFWVKSGWSAGFKREWKNFYHENWQDPDSSPDAQYRASQLKYYLYRRALAQVFAAVKKWSDEHGKNIPCYVPTHSLINYAHWAIVSPESSLLKVGCDGYIAQVWTGTARTPNVYEGKKEERTFETAYLEYGAMQNLVRASGRRVWYLNDPIEDNANHTWTDYQTNWQNTLTASLLQPEVWRYEVMPWPERIFSANSRYPSTAPVTKRSRRVLIPKEYSTELQSVITALGDMKQPPESVRWEASGTQGIGVLVSDTMMFQRGGPHKSDDNLGSFYGLAMPMVKYSIPVEPVQIETSGQKGFLDRYKVLMLTYEGQKPPTPEFHQTLVDWVKAGGSLVVVDNDGDAFNKVREWWNTAPLNFATPRLDLFEKLGLKPDATYPAKVGKGTVIYDPSSPAALTYKSDGADHVRKLVQQAVEAAGEKWTQGNSLVLRRGPYIVAAGLDESVSDPKPFTLHGKLVPLFDAALPVVDAFEIKPGTRQLLLDLSALPPGKVGTVAAACGVHHETVTAETIKLRADGIEDSNGVLLLALPTAPKSVTINGAALQADAMDYANGILRLRFNNLAAGQDVVVQR